MSDVPDLQPPAATTGDDDVRIGDAERGAVDARLHRAVGDGVLTLTEYDERAGAVWAARTRGDLAAVVRDLPGGEVRSAAPAPAPTGAVRRSIAVLGEERLSGPVAPGQEVQGYAVLGSTHLDLARDDLPGHVSLRAVAVMGAVQVTVPEGTHVDLTGVAVLGDRSVRTGRAAPGAPVVHLHAVAVLGSVTVCSGEVPPGGSVAVSAAAPMAWGHRQAPPPAVRRRRFRRWALAGVAVVAWGGLGVFSGDGSPGGGSGDRVVTVQPTDGQVRVPGGSGDVTVVVPDGFSAMQEGDRGSGNVTCVTACLPSSKTVDLLVERGSGDVRVLTASEFSRLGQDERDDRDH